LNDGMKLSARLRSLEFANDDDDYNDDDDVKDLSTRVSLYLFM